MNTAKHFDRDPNTNEVLWFSGPPIDIAKPTAPRHSIAYLHFRAMQIKRKKEDDNPDSSSAEKRQKMVAPPTFGETFGKLWSEYWGDGSS